MLLLSISSCEDDEYQKLVLQTPQQDGNTIILNWEQTNVSGFRYYMVMRSSDKRQYDVINDISTPTSDAFHKEITTFEDHNYPLEANTLFYKIVAVGDEMVSSPNLCYEITNSAMLVKGNLIDLHYMDESNKISILYRDGEYWQYKLKTLDCNTGSLSSNETVINLASSSDWYFWGKYNGKTEFYHYDGNLRVYVYDASNPQIPTILQAPYYLWYNSFTCNNKGMIYTYEHNKLHLLHRGSETLTQYHPKNYFYAEKLYYNSKDNKLYAVYNNIVQAFDLDDNGNVTGEKIQTLSSPNLTYIENSSLFLVYENSGGIKFFDMETGISHNTDLQSYFPYIALQHNNIIYISGNNSSIYRLSAENFKIINSTILRVTPRKVTISNDYLYFIGQYKHNNWILDKIKL